MNLLSLRSEDPPADSDVVVRGGLHGLDFETLRQAATVNFDGYGFYGISVFVVLDGSVEEVCSSVIELRRYGQIHRSTVGRLGDAGFALLATGRRPHFDAVLPDLTDSTFQRFRSCFGPSEPNPGRGQ
ncbi:MAG: hypothetical protein JO265_12990 [Acidimicrobiia bacterium]|nr:hypothetical protein [Acidimicrobiia bacterium]MBV8295848.1 hypothetical protein [Acidimicrobiia bacterium]